MSKDKESLAESVMTYLPLTKPVRVLVVDGDAACLAIVSRMLFIFGYKVLTATAAADAFSIVHDKEDDLQLVLAEVVHLPDMNKYEFLEKMGEVSKLPVVIMTDDDDDEIEMLGALFKGAQFYLVKPLTMNNIKNLWQFAAIKYNTNKYEVSDSDGDEEEEDNIHVGDYLSPEEKHCVSNEDVDDKMLIMNKEKQIHNDDDDKRKREGEAKNEEEDYDGDDHNNSPANSKKPKLVWSDELHDEKFSQAVSVLGIEGAHPKEVLQHMNVHGLTKQNIPSHLQKFRLSVKHEQDATQKAVTKDCYESGMGITNSKELACFGEEESDLVKEENFSGQLNLTNVGISDVDPNLLSNSTEQPQQQEQPQIPLSPPPPQKQEEEDMFDFTKGSTVHFRDEDLDDFW